MTLPVAGPAAAGLSRYTVKSSDVISDMRINVFNENSEKVKWYKERFLADAEIVENVVDNQTSTICWTIHRPKRGWYIRIRAPSFPPGAFISFMPLAKDSPYHTEAALSFSCRTNAPPPPPHDNRTSLSTVKSSTESSEFTLLEGASTASMHSYPPTPPVVRVSVQPPSPGSVHARLDALRPKRPRTQVTKFVLNPHSSPHVPADESSSFLTRVLSAFKNQAPSHSFSFNLCPIPPQPKVAPQASSPPDPHHHHHLSDFLPPIPKPLLTYHDRTPLLTIHAMNGVLELDTAEARDLGVETSFWVAVALTYLEFLGERESYLAAAAD
ncbi:hypothetical protein PLICRDRAFT_40401 [Plicaturopsis crispa FD-325 SS-3]|nr:hypothetical protein PLICRDRAFT_40401 [Plicaturopsis crispa FD-325 SS-3]